MSATARVTIEGSTVLVTGANRGLGAALCRALTERGAAKIYGGARNPDTVTAEGVIPVRLDITSPTDIAAAAEQCSDGTVLINNAGILEPGSAMDDDALDRGRRQFDTNVFGTAAMCQAFAPVLERNGGGAILNVLSVLSWLAAPGSAMYCASKAAAWSLTNSLRVDLAPSGVHVAALHVGLMQTDMAARLAGDKSDPLAVANAALDGIEAGAHEILADAPSRHVKAALSGDLASLYPTLG